MRISDWSSDVCSSDLKSGQHRSRSNVRAFLHRHGRDPTADAKAEIDLADIDIAVKHQAFAITAAPQAEPPVRQQHDNDGGGNCADDDVTPRHDFRPSEMRSEEHTSELQSLMRISYAVFCLKNKIIY